jgi:hypothetical protein
MDLGRSIFAVLNATPAVSVEGLGVFVRKRVPAHKNEQGTRLLPPSVEYDLQTDWDDEVVSLQAYLEATDPDSPLDWKTEIAAAVDELVSGLLQQPKVSLMPLGYLVRVGEQVTLQAPVETYVWPSFPIPTTDDAAITTVAEDNIKNASVDAVPIEGSYEEVSTLEEETILEEDTLEEDTFEEDTPPRSTWGWWVAALLVVTLAGGAYLMQPTWLTQWMPDLASKVQTEVPKQVEQQPIPPRVTHFDSIQREQLRLDSLKKDSIALAMAEADSLAKVAAAKPKVTYEIIVGSFATMAQAEKYVAQMKAKGITLNALDSRMPGNRKKVSYGSYPTEEAAYNALVQVQRDFEKGAWVARVVHD